MEHENDGNIIGAFRTFLKRFGKGAGRVGNQRTKSIQTTALLRLARILGRVLET